MGERMPERADQGDRMAPPTVRPLEGNGTTQPASGADQSQGQQGPGGVPDEYFRDTLFIGDSRTVGLMEYGQIQGSYLFRQLRYERLPYL